MRDRAPRAATLILATLSACAALAGAAQAQVAAPNAGGHATGLRYLSWANRPAGHTPRGGAAAGPTTARAADPNGIIPRRVAPSRAVSQPTIQPVAPPVAASTGLTPASAWLGPRTVPAYAPDAPNPVAYAATELTAPAPVAADTYAQPAAPSAPREAAPAAAADPMAPRRDAAIFRLRPQGPAAAAQGPTAGTPAAAHPGQLGARYYSVHRDAGRQPDPTPMPEPVYFDSVAVDLAEPPATEPPLRDAQGRRRPVANDDPSLP